MMNRNQAPPKRARRKRRGAQAPTLRPNLPAPVFEEMAARLAQTLGGVDAEEAAFLLRNRARTRRPASKPGE